VYLDFAVSMQIILTASVLLNHITESLQRVKIMEMAAFLPSTKRKQQVSGHE
jgi:hypothetical protein